MRKFEDKERCGAWRCEGFSCNNYSDFSYDCNHDLCHVCNSGWTCRSCNDFEDCEYAESNVQLQEGK